MPVIVRGGAPDGGLFDEAFREKVRSGLVIRRLRPGLGMGDAERFSRLEHSCLGDEGQPPLSPESVMGDVMKGLRINVLEYAGERTTLPNNSILERGEWVGHIDFKKTGHFKPEVLDEAIAVARRGGMMDWDALVREGFMPNCALAADLTNDPKDRQVGFLLLVDVAPKMRGMRLMEELLPSALADLKAEGFTHALAYARVPQLHKEAKDTQEGRLKLLEYLGRRRPDGLHPDWGIRFHLRAAGLLSAPIYDSSRSDAESRGQGALIVYDLRV